MSAGRCRSKLFDGLLRRTERRASKDPRATTQSVTNHAFVHRHRRAFEHMLVQERVSIQCAFTLLHTPATSFAPKRASQYNILKLPAAKRARIEDTPLPPPPITTTGAHHTTHDHDLLYQTTPSDRKIIPASKASASTSASRPHPDASQATEMRAGTTTAVVDPSPPKPTKEEEDEPDEIVVKRRRGRPSKRASQIQISPSPRPANPASSGPSSVAPSVTSPSVVRTTRHSALFSQRNSTRRRSWRLQENDWHGPITLIPNSTLLSQGSPPRTMNSLMGTTPSPQRSARHSMNTIMGNTPSPLVSSRHTMNNLIGTHHGTVADKPSDIGKSSDLEQTGSKNAQDVGAGNTAMDHIAQTSPLCGLEHADGQSKPVLFKSPQNTNTTQTHAAEFTAPKLDRFVVTKTTNHSLLPVDSFEDFMFYGSLCATPKPATPQSSSHVRSSADDSRLFTLSPQKQAEPSTPHAQENSQQFHSQGPNFPFAESSSLGNPITVDQNSSSTNVGQPRTMDNPGTVTVKSQSSLHIVPGKVSSNCDSSLDRPSSRNNTNFAIPTSGQGNGVSQSPPENGITDKGRSISKLSRVDSLTVVECETKAVSSGIPFATGCSSSPKRDTLGRNKSALEESSRKANASNTLQNASPSPIIGVGDQSGTPHAISHVPDANVHIHDEDALCHVNGNVPESMSNACVRSRSERNYSASSTRKLHLKRPAEVNDFECEMMFSFGSVLCPGTKSSETCRKPEPSTYMASLEKSGGVNVSSPYQSYLPTTGSKGLEGKEFMKVRLGGSRKLTDSSTPMSVDATVLSSDAGYIEANTLGSCISKKHHNVCFSDNNSNGQDDTSCPLLEMDHMKGLSRTTRTPNSKSSGSILAAADSEPSTDTVAGVSTERDDRVPSGLGSTSKVVQQGQVERCSTNSASNHQIPVVARSIGSPSLLDSCRVPCKTSTSPDVSESRRLLDVSGNSAASDSKTSTEHDSAMRQAAGNDQEANDPDQSSNGLISANLQNDPGSKNSMPLLSLNKTNNDAIQCAGQSSNVMSDGDVSSGRRVPTADIVPCTSDVNSSMVVPQSVHEDRSEIRIGTAPVSKSSRMVTKTALPSSRGGEMSLESRIPDAEVLLHEMSGAGQSLVVVRPRDIDRNEIGSMTEGINMNEIGSTTHLIPVSPRTAKEVLSLDSNDGDKYSADANPKSELTREGTSGVSTSFVFVQPEDRNLNEPGRTTDLIPNVLQTANNTALLESGDGNMLRDTTIPNAARVGTSGVDTSSLVAQPEDRNMNGSGRTTDLIPNMLRILDNTTLSKARDGNMSQSTTTPNAEVIQEITDVSPVLAAVSPEDRSLKGSENTMDFVRSSQIASETLAKSGDRNSSLDDKIPNAEVPQVTSCVSPSLAIVRPEERNMNEIGNIVHPEERNMNEIGNTPDLPSASPEVMKETALLSSQELSDMRSLGESLCVHTAQSSVNDKETHNSPCLSLRPHEEMSSELADMPPLVPGDEVVDRMLGSTVEELMDQIQPLSEADAPRKGNVDEADEIQPLSEAGAPRKGNVDEADQIQPLSETDAPGKGNVDEADQIQPLSEADAPRKGNVDEAIGMEGTLPIVRESGASDGSGLADDGRRGNRVTFHFKYNQSEVLPYSCLLCLKTMKSSSEAFHHMRDNHGMSRTEVRPCNVNGYVCPGRSCEHVLPSAERLQKHVLSEHPLHSETYVSVSAMEQCDLCLAHVADHNVMAHVASHVYDGFYYDMNRIRLGLGIAPIQRGGCKQTVRHRSFPVVASSASEDPSHRARNADDGAASRDAKGAPDPEQSVRKQ